MSREHALRLILVVVLVFCLDEEKIILAVDLLTI